jgi:hypothetical protein
MTPTEITLSRQSVEAVARRLLELLDEREAQLAAPGRYLSAAELSACLGVEVAYVYAHAAEFGAIRLGDGPRPRLRFDPEVVAERLAARDTAPQTSTERPSSPPRRPGGRGSSSAELLPIKGDAELSSTTAEGDRPGGAQAPPAAAPKVEAPAR